MSSVEPIKRSWVAELNLGFEHDGRRTIIKNRKHFGPLVIQKPFYPEGEVCHVYLLHPPGGIVGGDELHLNIKVENNGHALVTTPAATKFYSGNGFLAEQKQNIKVSADSCMEWLPQETIFFSGCEAKTSTIVHLEGDAKYIGWELICLGRPACDEAFEKGSCTQHVEVWRDNNPLVIERSRLQGGDELLDAMWGMQGYVVMATLIATHVDKLVLQYVREEIEKQNLESKTIRISCTLIGDILICRVLAHQIEVARNNLVVVWKIIRPHIMQRQAVIPRIWNT
ncbi:MAG: urease accessory protein UreD [Woeseiaceae bacterium]